MIDVSPATATWLFDWLFIGLFGFGVLNILLEILPPRDGGSLTVGFISLAAALYVFLCAP